MAIRIENWGITSGTCEIEQCGRKFTLNLYGMGQSNCFLTSVYEYVNSETGKTMEQLQWFFCDETHAKKMLGLQKTYNGKLENVFADEIKSITLYKKTCREWVKIRNLFRKAFGPDFPIEIREEK